MYVLRSKEKGLKLGGTGNEVRSNREKGTGKLVVGSRPHELGRTPLHIGASDLIYLSGRQNPFFYFVRLIFNNMIITHGSNERCVKKHNCVGMSRYFVYNYAILIEQSRRKNME